MPFYCSALRVKSEPISDAKFIKAALPVIPLIQAAACKLDIIANVNRTVHRLTYNNLIASAAAQQHSQAA